MEILKNKQMALAGSYLTRMTEDKEKYWFYIHIHT